MTGKKFFNRIIDFTSTSIQEVLQVLKMKETNCDQVIINDNCSHKYIKECISLCKLHNIAPVIAFSINKLNSRKFLKNADIECKRTGLFSYQYALKNTPNAVQYVLNKVKEYKLMGFAKVLLLDSYSNTELCDNLHNNDIYLDSYMATPHDVSKRTYVMYQQESFHLIQIYDSKIPIDFSCFEYQHKDLTIQVIGNYAIFHNSSKNNYHLHPKWPCLDISTGMYYSNISQFVIKNKFLTSTITIPSSI